MKKVTAMLLVIIMVFALAACSGQESDSKPSESPAASQSDGNAKAQLDPQDGSTAGYMTDEVDHFAREPYNVMFCYPLSVAMWNNFSDSFEALGEKMNFNLTTFDAQSDYDKYVSTVEQAIDTGVDGFFFAPGADIPARLQQLCNEANIPCVFILIPSRDKEGHVNSVTVTLDNYIVGATMWDWVEANYSTYLSGADLATTGIILLDYSVTSDFSDRATGMKDQLLSRHPELESNVFYVDTASEGWGQSSGYNKTAATLAANPDFEHWIVFGVAEDFVVGACRALESNDKGDKSIALSVGNDVCFDQWDNGESPEWVATVPVYRNDFCPNAAAGLVALMDGRATMDTLWADERAEGDTATSYDIPLTVVTRDTYKDYIAESDAKAG